MSQLRQSQAMLIRLKEKEDDTMKFIDAIQKPLVIKINGLEVVTVQQAANMLDVTRANIYRHVEVGNIRHFDIGFKMLYKKDVDRML